MNIYEMSRKHLYHNFVESNILQTVFKIRKQGNRLFDESLTRISIQIVSNTFSWMFEQRETLYLFVTTIQVET